MADPAYLEGALSTGIKWPWNATGPAAATDLELVKGKIELVLFTFLGSHKMEPTFGSNLLELVFENRGKPLEVLADMEIRQTLAAWMPEVSVVGVTITESDVVEGLVTIDVDYEYLGEPDSWSGAVNGSAGSGGL